MSAAGYWIDATALPPPLPLVPLQLHVPRGAADGLDAGWASSAAM